MLGSVAEAEDVGGEAVRHAETADSLSLAFLHLLEKLAPVERAVFLLREVFDYLYEEIAPIVGKSPENCRQILARAHRHVAEGRLRFDVSREERDEVAGRFLAAWEEGDTEGLVEVLAPDATVYGDPGVVFYDPERRAIWVAAFEIAEGVVVAVRSVLNPDKLTHVPAR